MRLRDSARLGWIGMRVPGVWLTLLRRVAVDRVVEEVGPDAAIVQPVFPFLAAPYPTTCFPSRRRPISSSSSARFDS